MIVLIMSNDNANESNIYSYKILIYEADIE